MAIIHLQIEIFLLILVGYFCAKKGWLTKQAQSQISNLILMIFLPCSIIKSFQIDLTKEILQSTLLILLISIAIQCFCALLNRYIYAKMPEKRRVCCKYGTIASNASFMGMPIAQGVFGELGLLYASIFILPQRVCMYSSGIALFSNEKNGNAFLKVIMHPCVFSIFIGIVLMLLRMVGIYLPTAVSDTLGAIGSCSTALSMMVIGAILESVDTKHLLDKDVVFYTVVRLVFIPMIILVTLRLLSVDLLSANVCVLLSSMPAASTTAMLAQKYDGDYLFASRLVFVSTFVSMVTLPLITLIFQII